MFSKWNRLKKIKNSQLWRRGRQPTQTHQISIDFRSALPIRPLFVSLSISHISHCSDLSPTHYCLSITRPSLCVVFVICVLVMCGEKIMLCAYSVKCGCAFWFLRAFLEEPKNWKKTYVCLLVNPYACDGVEVIVGEKKEKEKWNPSVLCSLLCIFSMYVFCALRRKKAWAPLFFCTLCISIY